LVFFRTLTLEDGDALDVLVPTDAFTFPGCQLDARLIGVIKANQKEREKENRNHRLIAEAEQSVLYAEVKELDDLDPTLLRQIEEFFTELSPRPEYRVHRACAGGSAKCSAENRGGSINSCTTSSC